MSKSKVGLQNLVDKFQEFCGRKGLEINVQKCDFAIFENSRQISDEFIIINGERVKNVPEFRYLEVWFERKNKMWNKHKSVTKGRLVAAANKATYMFKNNSDKSVNFMTQLIETFITSIFSFACHSWCHS